MKVYKAYLLGIIMVCLLVGCTTKLPKYDELESKNHIPKTFKNTQDTKDSEALAQMTRKDSALEQFSLLIDDKQLQDLLAIALERNTDVLTMVSRIKQAKSQVKINTAGMFPVVSPNISANYTDRASQSRTIRSGQNSISANLSLSWELDLFGKLNALRQSSKKDYLQAQSNLANTQIVLIADVGTLYFTLRDNAYNLALGEQILENLKEIDTIGKQQFEQGLIDINSYKTIKANVTTQQNTLETLRYTYEQNKNALLVLLDLNDTDLESKVNFLDSSYIIPHISEFDIDNTPSRVLLKRPDVEASIYALYSQLYKETNAKAARLPTISLSGSIGETIYSTMGAGNLVFQIASSITTPLLNRTSLKQNYLIQKELTKEAYYTLQNTINTALSEIENSLYDKDSKKRQVANNKVILDIGFDAYQTDLAKSQGGMIDRSTFLTNQNSYFSLQTQFFTSQMNEFISAITLFKSFGGDLYFSPANEQSLESLEQSQENPQ